MCAVNGARVRGVRRVGVWCVVHGCVGVGVCMRAWARAGVYACARMGVGVGVGVGVGSGVGSFLFILFFKHFCGFLYFS